MAKKGKRTKKKPVAHNVAVALLREAPRKYLKTLACLYREGTVVPAEDISELICAFEEAYNEIRRGSLDLAYSSPEVEQALRALRKQAEEAKEKARKKRKKTKK